DLLGFGFSKKPDENYTLAVHVNALEKFISKNVKEKSIIFIGHSLGALVSLAYASTHRASVKKLILLSLPFYRSEYQAIKIINKSRSLSFLFADTLPAHLACRFVCTFRPAFRLIAPFFIKDFPKKVVQDSFLHMHASYFSTLRNVILQHNIVPLLNKQLNKKIVLIFVICGSSLQLSRISCWPW
ncbi:alpha/beta fold hydrolase, partial [Patescibacteria group bacterium]|nr:alpha/beta fold hydrolase [Patescibacteria group bacterium]